MHFSHFSVNKVLVFGHSTQISFRCVYLWALIDQDNVNVFRLDMLLTMVVLLVREVCFPSERIHAYLRMAIGLGDLLYFYEMTRPYSSHVQDIASTSFRSHAYRKTAPNTPIYWPAFPPVQRPGHETHQHSRILPAPTCRSHQTPQMRLF